MKMNWRNLCLIMIIKNDYKKPRKARLEIKKEKKSIIIKKDTKTSKGNVLKWHNMPIKVLKSFAGWNVKEKAPISALILTYFETSIITYVVVMLICFYRMLKGLISVDEFMMRLSMAVVAAFIIAFMVDVGVLILLKIVEPFFNKPLSKNAVIRRIIIIIGLIISIVELNAPMFTDYIEAVGGFFVSLIIFRVFGICTIKNFNDRTKKLRRNTKIIINRSPKEYIEYAIGVITTIAGFF